MPLLELRSSSSGSYVAATRCVLGINGGGARPSAVGGTGPGNNLGSAGGQLGGGAVTEGGGDRGGFGEGGRNLRHTSTGREGVRGVLGCTVQDGRAGCINGALSSASAQLRLAIEQAGVDVSLELTSFAHGTGDLGADDVVLVSRDGDSSQDTDDRDNDHQFDQGETLLNTLHGVDSLFGLEESDCSLCVVKRFLCQEWVWCIHFVIKQFVT